MLELENEEFAEQKNNEQKQSNDDDDDEDEDEDDDGDKIEDVSAIGLLSQILVMFGSLDTERFIQIITNNAFDNVLQSLANATKISFA